MDEKNFFSKQLVIVDHPLIQTKLSILRCKTTGLFEFRRALHEISGLLLFAALKEAKTNVIEVETPLAKTSGICLSQPLLLVPILRAGLGMAQGMLKLIPEASVGHLGMFRNEETLTPINYYAKLPPHLESFQVLLLDPMLATGKSIASGIDLLKQGGAKQIQVVSIVSCPTGLQHVMKTHSDITIFTAVIDQQLNEKGYIVPGLGDAGDRYFGT